MWLSGAICSEQPTSPVTAAPLLPRSAGASFARRQMRLPHASESLFTGPIRSRKVTLDQTQFFGIHFGPLTWAFGGGEGTRTLGLYIAKVRFSVF